MKAINISKTGKHTARGGTTVDFTDAVLAATAEVYDPGLHPAPIVIGHPKTDMPAYGWVKRLSFSDGNLNAEPEQVEPQFAEMVKNGRFRTVSASFYAPDQHGNPAPGNFYLKHVGFLGAAAPAIKGLKQVEFTADDDGITIEFAAPTGADTRSIAELLRAVREMIIEKFGREEADKTVPRYQLEELEQASPGAEPTFSEAKTDNPSQESKPMTEEELKAKEQELKKREEKLKEQEAENKKEQAAQFCEDLVKQGRLLPAQKSAATALLSSLATETTVEFSEGEGTISKSQAQTFKDLLSSLPQQVEFAEVAGTGLGEPRRGEREENAEVGEDLTSKV